MSTFRIFGFSLLMAVVALITGYLHGGPTALFLLAVLALLEVSLSFRQRIINAAILQRMSPFGSLPDHRDSYCGVRDAAGVPIIWTTAGWTPSRNGAGASSTGPWRWVRTELITAAHPADRGVRQHVPADGTWTSSFTTAISNVKWLRSPLPAHPVAGQVR